jgi:hypothetical protein
VSESQHDDQYVDQEAPAQDGPDVESRVSPEAVEAETVDASEAVGPAETPETSEASQTPEEVEPDLSAAAPSRVEHTGNPVVDSVLDSLEELDRLPPSEHVAVFEAAHERLRGALSDAGEPPADA